MENTKDVIVIGGGQSGLACGYYLRRTGLDYLIIDGQEDCGGAWRHAWDSLTLFSPSEQSSLPGWRMPPSQGDFPTRQEVIQYLCEYEKRYDLKVLRPIHVTEVNKVEGIFLIKSRQGEFRSKALVAATGTWSETFIPSVPGRDKFEGLQLHSSHYQNPAFLEGKKVLVVGEGNSGAQILAEVSLTNPTTWATLESPSFLPDNVDGRVLFGEATAKYRAKQKGEKITPSQFTLGNIVMLPSVRHARDRGVLQSKGSFSELWENGVIWENGEQEAFDAIIWCTGFHYATSPLSHLVNRGPKGKVQTNYTRALDTEGLWMVGYGNWTGFASATLIGVGRSARHTVREIETYF